MGSFCQPEDVYLWTYAKQGVVSLPHRASLWFHPGQPHGSALAQATALPSSRWEDCHFPGAASLSPLRGLALREALPLQSSGWDGKGKGPR